MYLSHLKQSLRHGKPQKMVTTNIFYKETGKGRHAGPLRVTTKRCQSSWTKLHPSCPHRHTLPYTQKYTLTCTETHKHTHTHLNTDIHTHTSTHSNTKIDILIGKKTISIHFKLLKSNLLPPFLAKFPPEEEPPH